MSIKGLVTKDHLRGRNGEKPATVAYTEKQDIPLEGVSLSIGPPTTPPAYVAEALKCQETIDQLRKDRDELLREMEIAIGWHWEDPDHDAEAHQERCRALLGRIKEARIKEGR
jgi:hypothetical protein